MPALKSTLNLARAKYNRASSRVFYLNNAVRRTQLRVQRLLAIQNALSKIHKTADDSFRHRTSTHRYNSLRTIAMMPDSIALGRAPLGHYRRLFQPLL